MANTRNKRDRFIELAEARVQRAVKDLHLIGNLANLNNYDFTEDDAQRIVSALEAELKLLRAKFQTSLSRRIKHEFKLK